MRLAGLDGDLCGSSSKKLECEALLLRAGEEGRRASVSTVLSANDGRGVLLLAPIISSPAPSSSMGLAWDSESVDSAIDTFVILVLLSLANADCEADVHCEDILLLGPGSFEVLAWRGESCSGSVAIRSRGGGIREKPLLADFGSFGWLLRVEIGRGLGRVCVEPKVVCFVVVLGGGILVMLLIPEAAIDANPSLEAAGRRRGFLSSDPPARFSLDGEGRMAVGMAEDFGIGKREVGRGRALDLPG